MDGCGNLGHLVPNHAAVGDPGIFTAAILILIYAWNEFFFALLILTNRNNRLCPWASHFQGEFTMPWGELVAASVVATLPLIAVVLCVNDGL